MFRTLMAYCTLFALATQLPAQSGTEAQDALRIVVIGSSTAEGVGASTPENAWVPRYRTALQTAYPGIEVVNLGKGGYSGYQLLPDGSGPFRARPLVDSTRNISKAIAFRPDAVIINLPSNDTVSGHSAEEQLDNLKTIIRAAVQAGALVWICTPQPRNLDDGKIAVQTRVRDSLLNRYGSFTIDAWTTLADAKNILASAYDAGDGTHLNDAGHALLFNRILDAGIPETIIAFRQSKHLAAAFMQLPLGTGCAPLGILAGLLRPAGKK